MPVDGILKHPEFQAWYSSHFAISLTCTLSIYSATLWYLIEHLNEAICNLRNIQNSYDNQADLKTNVSSFVVSTVPVGGLVPWDATD